MSCFRGLSSRKGVFLGEILISLIVVSSLVYITFSIFGSMSTSYSFRELYSRAYYLASMRMEEILSRNYENITSEGCMPISVYTGDDDYLSGNICVNVSPITDWDSVNDVDAKNVTVTVEF